MQVIERILHMLRVKDCRHVCLFCEHYDMCKQETGSRKEVKENEHEGASDFGMTVSSRCRLVVPKVKETKPENKFAKYASS